MRPLLALFFFAGSLLTPFAHAECSSRPITLQQMRDCYRVLLVFAPSPANASFRTQIDELGADGAGFRERNLILVPVLEPGAVAQLPQFDLPTATLTPEEEAKAREKYHDRSSFQIVLVGKDGHEKTRSSHPMAADKLYGTIDGMPMRKDEMKHP